MVSLRNELGFTHVLSSHSLHDVLLLFLSRFVRLFAFGAVTPILVLYLRHLGFADKLVGAFLSFTLVGDVLLSLVITFIADKVGRRRMLALGAVLMAGSGITFALSDNYFVLLAAAVLGVVSPSGGEVGPFSAVEVGMLSQLVEPDARVYVLMWYEILGFLGTSTGAFFSGVIVTSLLNKNHPLEYAYRAVFILYFAVAVIKIAISLVMTSHSELVHPERVIKPVASSTAVADDERQPLLEGQQEPIEVVAAPTKLPILRLLLICGLFSWDTFGSSIIPIPFISYYWKSEYGADIGSITRTLAAASTLAGLSQLVAGSLARRIGIIATMVFTHMPAQLLSIALAFAPNLSAELTIYLARSSISSMDVAVRSAFLSSVVPKESRTRFLGIVNVCKTLASTPGPTLSGALASRGQLKWAFVASGCLKLIYDISLWVTFKTAKLEH